MYGCKYTRQNFGFVGYNLLDRKISVLTLGSFFFCFSTVIFASALTLRMLWSSEIHIGGPLSSGCRRELERRMEGSCCWVGNGRDFSASLFHPFGITFSNRILTESFCHSAAPTKMLYEACVPMPMRQCWQQRVSSLSLLLNLILNSSNAFWAKCIWKWITDIHIH